MKMGIQISLAVTVALFASGCATPYMANRGRDAADILTATVGTGFGVKARVGPIVAGIYENHDDCGLRGGEYIPEFGHPTPDVISPVFKIPMEDGGLFPIASSEQFDPPGARFVRARRKAFEAGGAGPLTLAGAPSGTLWTLETLHYCGQVECVLGAHRTVRLGFNLVEMIDFILGWTTIDILRDDLRTGKPKEKSNQVPEDTARKLADPQH